MAQDAMLPVPAVADPGTLVGAEAEPVTEPLPRRRHAAGPANTDTHGSAWPAIVFYMAFGAAGCLLILSGVFGFSTAINKMDRGGIMITCIVAGLIIALLVSAASCLLARCYRCVWESMAIVVVLAGNWVSWFYSFNLPREVMQLFS